MTEHKIHQPHTLTQRNLLRAFVVCVLGAIALLLWGVLYADAQERSTALTVALGGYLTLSVVDAQQTHACLTAGTCTEANALLRPFASKPNRVVAVKLAANSGVVCGIWKLRRKHPKVALALALGAAGFQVSVVAMNARRR